MKPKAAFVGHSFHEQTKSTKFFKEILAKTFDLDFFCDESWLGGESVPISALEGYPFIFFLQALPNARKLSRLKNSKLVWVPMYDSVVNLPKFILRQHTNVPLKIVSFCKTMDELFRSLGFRSYYLQYFPNPNEFKPVGDYKTKRVYFWNRTDGVRWDAVKILIEKSSIDDLVFVDNPDPGHKTLFPSKEDIKHFNIRFSKGFLPPHEYKKLVSSANIYIAPRLYEGIGMSFLEAMARGQCVVAPNLPTMNEYIVSGKNGYLYNSGKPSPLPLGDFDVLGKAAREQMTRGYAGYTKRIPGLMKFILESPWPRPKGGILTSLKKTWWSTLHLGYKVRNIALP